MSGSLSNFDIIDICKRLSIPLAGVVSRNEKYPSCKGKLLVINLDDKAGQGTHWVGLIEFPDHFEYFDSFGVYAPEEVIKFTKGKKLMYQDEQMQSMSSSNCGWFVIIYALVRLNDPSSSIKYVFKKFINERSVGFLKSSFGVK